MKPRKRITAALAAVLLGLGGAVAVSSPAQAAFYDEPWGLFTICDHFNCNNDDPRLSYNIDFEFNGVCIEVASWMDNITSGAINKTPRTEVVWYRLHGCEDVLDVPGADNAQDYDEIFHFPSLSSVNDKLSSFRVWKVNS